MQLPTQKTTLSQFPQVTAGLRRVLALLLVPYVAWLIFAYEYHFLDGVNLLLHEGGHMLFSFMGETLHILGGTLGQLFFPAAAALYFFRRKAFFDAAVMAVWLAESLMYTANYMSDARAQSLPLVGGQIHDWNWLFSRWGILAHDELIGGLVHLLASVLALAALFVCFTEISWGRRRLSTAPSTDVSAGPESQKATACAALAQRPSSSGHRISASPVQRSE